MKGLAITHKGFEDICAKEIKELIGVKTKVLDGCVEFEFLKLEELCLLCYKAQSVIKILYLIDSVDYSSVSDLGKSAEKIEFDKWFSEKTTFAVRCMHVGDISESTQEIESKVGEFILGKKKSKVDLGNPSVTFFVYIVGGKGYFGIDFSGIDLSKRQYKIFQHPYALKGTIAYCLFRLVGECSDIVLDPFCGSATILIEAGLYCSKFPINFYQKDKFAFLGFKTFEKFDFDKFFSEIDKKAEKGKMNLNGFDHQLRYVKAAKNNAKIAGVEKLINFSRVDIEWLDTKMDKEEVDLIVTNPPEMTHQTNPVAIQKLYDEFFHQVEFVLKKEGKIVIISKNIETMKKVAVRKGFKTEEERKVWSGKQEYCVVVFGM